MRVWIVSAVVLATTLGVAVRGVTGAACDDTCDTSLGHACSAHASESAFASCSCASASFREIPGDCIPARIPSSCPAGGCVPSAPLPACPPECSRCHDGNNTCVIDCSGFKECSPASPTNTTHVACPDGALCLVECSGVGSCADTNVTCPSTGECQVVCSGRYACIGLEVHAPDQGPLMMQCSDLYSCALGTVVAGAGPVSVACPGTLAGVDLQFNDTESTRYVHNRCDPTFSLDPSAFACTSGECLELVADGEACGGGIECQSGLCVDGTCCSSAGGCCQAGDTLDGCHKCYGPASGRAAMEGCVPLAITSVDPSTVAVYTRQSLLVHVQAEYVSPVHQVTVNGQAMTVTSSLSVDDHAVILSVLLSSQPEEGPANITVTVGNHRDTVWDASLLYVTSGCESTADERRYGNAQTCRACPDNAECPGGFRVWPLPGYWNSDETDGTVDACPRPEWCLGGADSRCVEGRTGSLCSQCASGYYRLGNECLACGDDSGVYLLMTLNAVFLVFLVISTSLFSDRYLGYTLTVTSVLQMVRATASASVVSSLPTPVRAAYSFLSLFAIDYAFLRPGCLSAPPDAITSYYGNMVVSLLYIVPCLGVLLLLRVVAGVRGAVRPAFFYQSRFIRAALLLLELVYLSVTARSLGIAYCSRVSGQLSFALVNDPSVICYQGRHLLPGAAGMSLAVVFSLLFPAFSFILVAIQSQHPFNPAIVARYGHLFVPFKDSSVARLLPLGRYVVFFILAAHDVFLDGMSIQPYVPLVTLVVYALVLAAVRPFNSTLTTVVWTFRIGIPLGFSLVNLLTELNVSSSVVLLAFLIYAGMVLCFSIGVIVSYVVSKKRQSSKVDPTHE